MNRTSTILIIDDEPAAREAVEALLASENYDLHFATNGQEGLAMAADILPDLILLDVMMPGMNGYDVCKKLRADSLMAEIPVVMITALDDRGSRLLGIEAGADDFIAKPFDKTELRTRVRTICRLNRFGQLLTERLRFHWMIEQSQDGYLIIDHDNRILHANAQAQVFLNIESEEEGPSFIELVESNFRAEPEAAWTHWKEYHSIPKPLYLFRPETPASPIFWLKMDELSLTKEMDQKRVIHLRDVTNSMNTDNEMRRFHTTITHKLQTPLSVMLISLQLLQKQAQQENSIDLLEAATDALASANRLDADVRSIFRYVGMSVLAQQDDQLPITSIPEIISACARNLQIAPIKITIDPALRNKHLTLTFQALDSILWELLDNARKFHPSQSPEVEIIVRARPVVENRVQILVCDDGISLSPEQIKWAFTPYLQGEKYFTGESQGMGLGLPLAAKLVWQANGHIRLMNRSDKPGVIVDIVLPAAK